MSMIAETGTSRTLCWSARMSAAEHRGAGLLDDGAAVVRRAISNSS
jgi:hypothetical protein